MPRKNVKNSKDKITTIKDTADDNIKIKNKVDDKSSLKNKSNNIKNSSDDIKNDDNTENDDLKQMVTKETIAKLRRQQYRVVGRHSAVKICSWTKNALRDEGFCYKQQFYGIKSHRCLQFSVSLACSNACIFCWRELSCPQSKEWKWGTADDVDKVIDGVIDGQIELISGFGGYKNINHAKLKESKVPMHFAISLTGESLLNPKINEYIDELKKRKKSIFVVTNGQFPDEMKNLSSNITQLYLSADAPNEEIFVNVEKSLFKDSWKRFNKCLDILKKLRETKKIERTAIRITLIKGITMVDIQGWASIIKKGNPMFIEVKSYMHMGSSQGRLEKDDMPYHEEVKDFSVKLAKESGYIVVDEREDSKVVLLMKKEDLDKQFIDFEKL